jgi:hypothetical protein
VRKLLDVCLPFQAMLTDIVLEKEFDGKVSFLGGVF